MSASQEFKEDWVFGFGQDIEVSLDIALKYATPVKPLVSHPKDVVQRMERDMMDSFGLSLFGKDSSGQLFE